MSNFEEFGNFKNKYLKTLNFINFE